MRFFIKVFILAGLLLVSKLTREEKEAMAQESQPAGTILSGNDKNAGSEISKRTEENRKAKEIAFNL